MIRNKSPAKNTNETSKPKIVNRVGVIINLKYQSFYLFIFLNY